MFIRGLVSFLFLVAAVDGWSNETNLQLKLPQTERPTSMTPT
jgi:hypothetical protein